MIEKDQTLKTNTRKKKKQYDKKTETICQPDGIVKTNKMPNK